MPAPDDREAACWRRGNACFRQGDAGAWVGWPGLLSVVQAGSARQLGGKVAGRLLAPYLARLSDLDRRGRELVDLGSPDGAGPREREDDHRDALELALTAADLDARQRDYAAALRWLEVAEHLNLALPSDYAGKRERWAAQRKMQRSGAR
jgi:hypothetical protein